MDDNKKDLEQNQNEENTTPEQSTAPAPAPNPPANPVNRIVIAIAAISVIAAVALAVIACGNKEEHIYSYGEWQTVKAQTCETDGVKERFCSCGEKQSDTLYATGHSFGGWTVVENATCAAEGSNNDLTANYILMNNIDLEGMKIDAIGSSDKPFVGTFDGRGFTISNFTLEVDSDGYCGLFICNSGTIRNLNIKNLSVNSEKRSMFISVDYVQLTTEQYRAVKLTQV